MKIRQRKRARTPAVFASAITSNLLSSRFSPQSTNNPKHSIAKQPKNFSAQLQRAIKFGHNISQIAISAPRAQTSKNQHRQNTILQSKAKYQFAPTKDKGAKLLPVKTPSKTIKKRDRKSQSPNWAKFQGKYQPLFVNPNDVEQGQVPNCYLLAEMVALARTNPDEMMKYIRPKENGVYEVTIYVNSEPNAKINQGSKTPVTFILDDILPPSNYGKSAFEQRGEVSVFGEEQLLLMLIEKAYATYKGTYDSSLWSQPEMEISELTSNSSDTYHTDKFSDKQLANIIDSSLIKTLSVTTATSTMSENAKERAANINRGITERTTYNVKKVDPSSLTINLQSSWGSSYDVNNLSISEFRKFFHRIRLRR